MHANISNRMTVNYLLNESPVDSSLNQQVSTPLSSGLVLNLFTSIANSQPSSQPQIPQLRFLPIQIDANVQNERRAIDEAGEFLST